MKSDSIKVLAAPNYEGLSIADFLEKASEYGRMISYLPEHRDIHRLPRNWIINLMHTLIGDDILQFTKSVVEERN